MFFLGLTLSLIAMITGIVLLLNSTVVPGVICLAIGILLLILIFCFYYRRKNGNCGSLLDCIDVPDCDCSPDCSL